MWDQSAQISEMFRLEYLIFLMNILYIACVVICLLLSLADYPCFYVFTWFELSGEIRNNIYNGSSMLSDIY